MPEDRKPFLLRLDPKVYRDLERWAHAELRSVNGQIEFILKVALADRKRVPPDDPSAAAGKK